MTNTRQIRFSPPDITQAEIDAVSDTLRSGWITTGPKTKLLEKKISEFIGTHKTVCLNSATAALELTLRVLGIGHGDEVITSAFTYTASASVIHHVGAKIVLVDTAVNSLEMDYDILETLITNRTKAIIPVDIGGIMCNYDKLLSIAHKYKNLFIPNNDIQKKIGRISIVSDAAHSFGAELGNIKNGMFSDFTCFSFHAVKNLTTSEGGAVTWTPKSEISDDFLYSQFQLFSLHGQNKDALSKNQIGGWEYDIIYPGFKCNLTDIMSAIGLVQLERYPSLLQRRFEIINKYNNFFLNTNIIPIEHKNSSGHLYMVRLNTFTMDQRNQIIIEMGRRGISCNVHYKPLPLMTAYKNMGFEIQHFPNSYLLYSNIVSLPLHTLLSDEDIEYVAQALLEIVKTYEKI